MTRRIPEQVTLTKCLEKWKECLDSPKKQESPAAQWDSRWTFFFFSGKLDMVKLLRVLYATTPRQTAF